MNYKKCDVCQAFAPESSLEEATLIMTKHPSCPISPIPMQKLEIPQMNPGKRNIEDDLKSIADATNNIIIDRS